MTMSSSQVHSEQDDWEAMMAHLVTEDDTPVDNVFSEKQQRLLPQILFSSWDEGRPFVAMSNVGLFYSLHDEPPVVPDFMLSLGVEPRPLSKASADQSYFTWVYGKPPDLVVEIVSRTPGGELDRKLEIYARVRVTYYVVFDPYRRLGERELRAFRLVEGRYLEMVPPTWFPEVGLGLTLWDGSFEDLTDRWLRFTDSEGRLLPTPNEKAAAAEAAAEAAKADAGAAKADAEAAKADAEAAKADAEAAKGEAEAAKARADAARAETQELIRRLKEAGLEP